MSLWLWVLFITSGVVLSTLAGGCYLAIQMLARHWQDDEGDYQ